MSLQEVQTVRENEKSSRSGNYNLSQGNLKFWQKSGKNQGILESEKLSLFSY